MPAEDYPALYTRSDRFEFKEDTFLVNARRQAQERGYGDFPIVDVDTHHFELASWSEIVRYMPRGPIREWAEGAKTSTTNGRSLQSGIIPIQAGNQSAGGRTQQIFEGPVDYDSPVHVEAQKNLYAMDMLGVDYAVMFPNPLLYMGLHPDPVVEAELTMAYTEWLLENVVPESPRLKVLAYLPFNSPEHSLQAIRKFGEHPAVTGFMVTTPRLVGAHRNEYAPIYAELRERDLTLAFHAAYNWGEQGMMQLDKFISVHSLGFTFTTMVHCTNLLMHGILERFPGLKVLWIEAGLAWIPFLMQRLDGEYLKRTSDAPLLKKLPSEYMRDMYYANQPLEAAVRPESRSTLEATFEIMDAENTLVFSSDYPHWDWDLPSAIYDLPFLSEQAKRKILGGNACKILNIQPSDPLPTADLRPSATDDNAQLAPASG